MIHFLVVFALVSIALRALIQVFYFFCGVALGILIKLDLWQQQNRQN